MFCVCVQTLERKLRRQQIRYSITHPENDMGSSYLLEKICENTNKTNIFYIYFHITNFLVEYYYVGFWDCCWLCLLLFFFIFLFFFFFYFLFICSKWIWRDVNTIVVAVAVKYLISAFSYRNNKIHTT